MRDQCLQNISELRLAQKVRTMWKLLFLMWTKGGSICIVSLIQENSEKCCRIPIFNSSYSANAFNIRLFQKKRRLRSKLYFVLIKSLNNVKFAKKLSICWFLAFEKTDFFLLDKELENANSGSISLSFSATIVIFSKKLYFLFLLTNKKNDGDAIAPVFVNAVAKS